MRDLMRRMLRLVQVLAERVPATLADIVSHSNDLRNFCVLATLSGTAVAADPAPVPTDPVKDVLAFDKLIAALKCQKAGYVYFEDIGKGPKGQRHYLCLIDPKADPREEDVNAYLAEALKR